MASRGKMASQGKMANRGKMDNQDHQVLLGKLVSKAHLDL
jgi:hypothetical protein